MLIDAKENKRMQQTYETVKDEFHFDIFVSYRRSERLALSFSIQMSKKNVAVNIVHFHRYIRLQKALNGEGERVRMRAQRVGLIRLNWLQKKIPLNLLHPHIYARTSTQTQGRQHTNANGVNG